MPTALDLQHLNIRATQTVTYTVPVDSRALINIIDRNNLVDVLAEPEIDKDTPPDGWTEEQVAAHLELIETAPDQIERLEREIAGRNITIQLRILVSGYSTMGEARWQGYRAEAAHFFEEQTGSSLVELVEVENIPEDKRQRYATLGAAVISWARALPAIEGIEARQIDLFDRALNDYTGDGWEAAPIPEAWKDIYTAIETIPYNLLTDLSQAARHLNAELIDPLAPWAIQRHTPENRNGVEN